MFRKKSKTLVTFLLDRTGSMAGIKEDTIGAFNTYLEELQKEGAGIEFTLLQFDSTSLDKICVRRPVKDVEPLNNENFVPRDMTPLIDAAYKTIEAVEKSLAAHPADKVVVCILTDGQENASEDHTWKELAALIKKKRKAGWQFNFMGAGIDAYDQGARMGIKRGETVSYDSTNPMSTQAAFVATAANTRAYSSGVSGQTVYTDTQKAASGDRYDRPVKTQMIEDFDL